MTDRPAFSVIIPTHNRPRLLRRCLQSVLAQELSAQHYEVIVVDDGSRPRTQQVLRPFLEDARVTVLRQSQQGWGAARQLGAKQSRAETLVFLDDDCIAPPDWLAAYTTAYAQHPEADGVAGGLRPAGRMNVAGHKHYLGHRAYFNQHNAPLGIDVEHAGRAWFTFGGNRSFRREVWWDAQPARALWYFDDYAIDLTLRERERFVYYEPAAWVAHTYILSVAQRIQAAYRYGRSEAEWNPPDLPGEKPLTMCARWARLTKTCPTVSVWERGWYALTQPLAWIARRLGQRSAGGR